MCGLRYVSLFRIQWTGVQRLATGFCAALSTRVWDNRLLDPEDCCSCTNANSAREYLDSFLRIDTRVAIRRGVE